MRRVYKSPPVTVVYFLFCFWGDFFLNHFFPPGGLSLCQVEGGQPEWKVDEDLFVQGAGGGLLEQVCNCSVSADYFFGLPSVLRWSCALGVVVVEAGWWLFILPRDMACC